MWRRSGQTEQKEEEMIAYRSNGTEPTIAAYVAEYIDPDAHLAPDDDPESMVAQLNRIFADDGGCGLTVDEMARYLHSLQPVEMV